MLKFNENDFKVIKFAALSMIAIATACVIAFMLDYMSLIIKRMRNMDPEFEKKIEEKIERKMNTPCQVFLWLEDKWVKCQGCQNYHPFSVTEYDDETCGKCANFGTEDLEPDVIVKAYNKGRRDEEMSNNISEKEKVYVIQLNGQYLTDIWPFAHPDNKKNPLKCFSSSIDDAFMFLVRDFAAVATGFIRKVKSFEESNIHILTATRKYKLDLVKDEHPYVCTPPRPITVEEVLERERKRKRKNK